MKLKLAVINTAEHEFLKDIESHNLDHNSLWKLPNLIIPIATILLALICHLAFSDNRLLPLNYLNLIINGSLPLIAINQISSTGLYVFKYNSEQEARYGKNSFLLRTKLFWLSIVALVLGVILFAFQVISNPFNSFLILITMFFVSICLLWFSSYVSRRVYLLQDSFISATYESTIFEGVDDHGQNWEYNQ
tara:strand:+ start:604 stop:1176 length:573 start_codon:yes stop_codon:yes gene_type:complete